MTDPATDEESHAPAPEHADNESPSPSLLGAPPPVEHGLGLMKAQVEARLFGSAHPRRIGHLRVLRRLGQGAMGAVYLARDERLDRDVALKLLTRRPSGATGSDDAGPGDPLWAEARAAARLAHPNVVAVHELSVFEGQPYMVMEHVEGSTLDAWLAAAPRSWPQVLDVMLQAGRGLAAAHERGLVHRDIKPANILVGCDGRVRVADFGLARDLPERSAVGSEDRSRAVAGTPAYMAPEQWDGQADERSDQFAYCVTLFVALYRQLPFRGASPADVQRAILAGRIEFPARVASARTARRLGRRAASNATIPGALTRALRRGLQPEPEHRYPSLGALLHALERVRDQSGRPSRRRRAGRTIILGATAAGTLALALFSRPSASPCDTLADAMRATWNDSRRAAVTDALVGTGAPDARAQAERTGANLDRYAEHWQEQRHRACLDASALARSPQRLCLELAQQEMEQLVVALEEADAGTVGLAVHASLSLPDVDACVQEREEGRSAALLEDHGGQVEAAMRALGRARALAGTGRLQEALAEAEAVADRVGALGISWLEAESLLAVGELLWQLHMEGRGGEGTSTQQLEVAQRTLQAALQAARHAERPQLAARAVVDLVSLNSETIRPDDLQTWLERAEPLVRAAGDPPSLRGRMLVARASQLADDGQRTEARALLMQALELHRSDRPDDPWMGKALNALGRLEAREGAFDRALEYAQRRRDLTTAALGRTHPWNAMALGSMAEAELALGRYEDALEHFEAALALRRGTYGPTSLFVAHTEAHLGDVQLALEDVQPARAHYEQVLEIWAAAGEPPWHEVRWAHNGLAAIALAEGNAAEALPHARAGAQGDPRPYEPHIDRVGRRMLGPTLAALGRFDEAAQALEQDARAAIASGDEQLQRWVDDQRRQLADARAAAGPSADPEHPPT